MLQENSDAAIKCERISFKSFKSVKKEPKKSLECYKTLHSLEAL